METFAKGNLHSDNLICPLDTTLYQLLFKILFCNRAEFQMGISELMFLP